MGRNVVVIIFCICTIVLCWFNGSLSLEAIILNDITLGKTLVVLNQLDIRILADEDSNINWEELKEKIDKDSKSLDGYKDRIKKEFHEWNGLFVFAGYYRSVRKIISDLEEIRKEISALTAKVKK